MNINGFRVLVDRISVSVFPLDNLASLGIRLDGHDTKVIVAKYCAKCNSCFFLT